MNYYIQGNKEKADQIKAAFEKLGYDIAGWNYKSDRGIYFTNESDKSVEHTSNEIFANLIKTHPDYKELELPKPHYDISNFNPFDKVLVRVDDTDMWTASLYSNYDKITESHFVTIDSCYSQCIPFNDDTKHLLGTTDIPDECYINW